MDMNAARIRFSLVDDEPQLVQQTRGAEIKLFSGGREVTYQHGRLSGGAQAHEAQVCVRRIDLRGNPLHLASIGQPALLASWLRRSAD